MLPNTFVHIVSLVRENEDLLNLKSEKKQKLTRHKKLLLHQFPRCTLVLETAVWVSDWIKVVLLENPSVQLEYFTVFIRAP